MIPWEESMGTARPDLKKVSGFFKGPGFNRLKKYGNGLSGNPLAGSMILFRRGLTNEDLLLNKYGKPAKANWNFDPLSKSHYCLDPSSANARELYYTPVRKG